MLKLLQPLAIQRGMKIFIFYRYATHVPQSEVCCLSHKEPEYYYCSENFCGCNQFLHNEDCQHIQFQKGNFQSLKGTVGYALSESFYELGLALSPLGISIKGHDEMTARLKTRDIVKGVSVKAYYETANSERVVFLLGKSAISLILEDA